jgi:CheY-like chemotaxis protein
MNMTEPLNKMTYALGVSASLSDQPWQWRGDAADYRDGLQPDDLVTQLLLTRGVERHDIARHKAPTLRDFMPDPAMFQDMDKAAKRLADAMGASIAVESTLDQGSTFTVSFPVTEIQASVLAVGSDVKPSKAESVSNEFPTIKRKILLADDRRDVWRIGKYFLEKCGATVVVAEDGQQAVEAAVAAREAGEPFDLVLMDMQMPVMTGREAVGKLRELDFTIPIIALTADAMVGERDACLEIGCNDFLPKPIDGPKLVRLIAATLSESSA